MRRPLHFELRFNGLGGFKLGRHSRNVEAERTVCEAEDWLRAFHADFGIMYCSDDYMGPVFMILGHTNVRL